MMLFIVTHVCTALLVALLLWCSPTLSGRGLFFTVRVGPAFQTSEGARKQLQRFRVGVVVVGVLAAAAPLLAFTAPPAVGAALQVWLPPLITLVQLGAGLGLYRRERARVAPHALPPAALPAGAPRLDASAETEGLPGGPLLQSLPFALLIASGIALAIGWNGLPERTPIHWSATGVANGWVHEQVVSMYALPVYGLLILSVLSWTGWLTLRRSRPGATADERRMKRLTLGTLLGAEYLAACLLSGISLLPLLERTGQGSVLPFFLLLPPLSMIGFAAVLMAFRPPGDGSGATPQELAALESAPDAMDAHWKGDSIYSNTADPALFVPKRAGLGYTLNFGHPAAYRVLAVMIGVPLLGALGLRLALH